ncbi:MAG: putative metal-dependent hydrolase [Bacteroidia bacterium]
MELEDLRFPVGRYQAVKLPNKDQIQEWISVLEDFPAHVIASTENLSSTELNWKYRPDGWNIKQVVHHCADSHLNSMMRFKLALTEDTPTIKTYMEAKWANLPDSQVDEIDASISILVGLHEKLGILLRNLSDEQLKREYMHPEHGRTLTVEETIGLYAWHSNHHLAHIKNAIEFKGKYN